jgi:pimeloyl-ACP methyl ester carboxylesterase
MTAKREDLPAALAAERVELGGRAGRLSYYTALPEDTAAHRPLLMVHSVNAAASAIEVRPLFEHYRHTRPVYALELPGFGFSERGARDYTPRLMSDAVAEMAAEIRTLHGGQAADALALSLGCEFLARAAAECPQDFASLALVSPTAFSGQVPRRGAPATTRGRPGLYRVLTCPLWSGALFALLTSRRSIGYFLRKTFGSSQVPRELIEYAWHTSHQPGARHAPFRFVSGYLSSADAFCFYEALRLPVWLAHGVRGDFQDYRLAPLMAGRENWTVQTFQTGALPHFELFEEFVARYDAFLDNVRRSG